MATTKPKILWKLTIDATNRRVPLRVGAANYAVDVTLGDYYARAPVAGSSLISALQTALNAAGSGLTFTVTISDTTGKVTISADGAFSILWLTGPNNTNMIGNELGFLETEDDVSAGNAVTSNYQHQAGWYCADPGIVEFPGRKITETEQAFNVTVRGDPKVSVYATRSKRAVSLSFLQKHKVFVEQEGTNVNEAIERVWQSAVPMALMRYYTDQTLNTASDFFEAFLDPGQADDFEKFAGTKPQYDQSASGELWAGRLNLRYIPT